MPSLTPLTNDADERGPWLARAAVALPVPWATVACFKMRALVLFLALGAACGGETGEVSAITSDLTTSCTVSLSAPALATYGDIIPVTASASCPTGTPTIQWYHRVSATAWSIIRTYDTATTLAFDTTGYLVGDHQFYAAVRRDGVNEGAAISATVHTTVVDNVPACTAASITTPTSSSVGRVGTPLPVDAVVTCPSGVVGEYQVQVRLASTNVWTIVPGFVAGPTSWTPPSDGDWRMKVGARSVGSHGGAQVYSPQVGFGVVPAGSNLPPIAAKDAATTQKNVPVTVDVTANDSDPDGDPLAVAIATPPVHGAAVVAGQAIVYSPALNYVGSDTLSYQLDDGHGGTAIAKLSLSVVAPSGTCSVAATPSTQTITQGTPVHLTASATCSSGTGLEYAWYSHDSSTSKFSLAQTWSSSPTVDVPTPTYGTYTIFALARTASAQGQSANVTATVIENVPQCTAASMVTPKSGGSATLGTPVTLSATATCPAGVVPEFRYEVRLSATTTWTVLPGYFTGSITWQPPIDGSWRILARARAQGATVPYQVSSPQIGFTVLPENHPPIANDVSASTDEDQPVSIFVLLGCSDPDQDPLTIVNVGLAGHGQVQNLGDHVEYTPDPDFNGIDAFTFTISDGALTATASAFVIVNAVNDPPIARADELTVAKNQAGTINVLANDTDVDGDTLVIAAVSPPAHGTASLSGSLITYTPAADFTGADSFDYTVDDGHGATATASVAVRVGSDATAAIAAGFMHTCSISTSGRLACWGYNSFGQLGDGTTSDRGEPSIVSSNWVLVGVGELHTCAIREDASLWCWGRNGTGQLGTGNPTDEHRPASVLPGTSWSSVATGWGHTCAIRSDATLWCWGLNDHGQLGTSGSASTPVQVGGDSDWISVAAAAHHTCGIRGDGSLWCWGRNVEGQLGDGTFGDHTTPARVGTLDTWQTVSTHAFTTCATQSSGSLWCWGSNQEGELGNNSFDNSPSPVQVGAGQNWDSVDVSIHTCARDTDGALWCWGANAFGMLGDGTQQDRLTPTRVAGSETWVSVATGIYHTCAIRSDGTRWCWGYNFEGELGIDRIGRLQFVPAAAARDKQWQSISSDGNHTCAFQPDGTLWCWGANNSGELGDGSVENRFAPVEVAGPWLAVASGVSHSCGIRLDGTLWCWGNNGFGQLGDGSPSTGHASPGQVGSESTWASVTVGAYHSCALKANGTLWCWGSAQYGQVGDGQTTNRAEPTQIGNDAWRLVTAGSIHTCGIHTDGSLWCWGTNAEGELGDGTFQQRTAPVAIAPARTWTQLGVGRYQTCATGTDHTLWCWGDNRWGQLGTGDANTRTTPTQIAASATWDEVEAGDDHACALQTDRSLWCWGANYNAMLGDATTENRFAPLRIGNSQWSSIAAATNNTCGIRDDGKLYCWGYGYEGQTADADPYFQLLPTEVRPDPVSLLAYWSGDGTTIESVAARDGALSSGGTFAPGIRDASAFLFNGSGAQFAAPTTGLPTGNTDRTLSLWVRLDAVPANEAFFGGYGGFGAATRAYFLGSIGTTQSFSQWGDVVTGGSVPLGGWHHVAVTNHGDQVSLYRDGVLVGTRSMTIDTAPGTQLLLGFLDPTHALTGAVDDVRVYDDALSADEIEQLYSH